jgi:hypothetical protein
MNLPTTPTTDANVLERGFKTRVSNFVNKAACRQYIMDWADQSRHHKFGRIAPEVFDELNAVLRKHMKTIVSRNPSFGKTLR